MNTHREGWRELLGEVGYPKLLNDTYQRTYFCFSEEINIKDFNIKFESFIDEFYKYDTFYSKLLFITHVYHSKQLFMFLYFGGVVIIKIQIEDEKFGIQ